jgi:hypothetical protein
MARRHDFDETVKLSPGLTISAVGESIDHIERELAAAGPYLSASTGAKRPSARRKRLVVSRSSRP